MLLWSEVFGLNPLAKAFEIVVVIREQECKHRAREAAIIAAAIDANHNALDTELLRALVTRKGR